MKAPAIKTGRGRETRHHYFSMTGAGARRSTRSVSVAHAVLVGVLWFACANAVGWLFHWDRSAYTGCNAGDDFADNH
jgi:hypothetical protein